MGENNLLEIYDRISTLAKGRGVTLAKVEAALGFSRGSIGKMKVGRKPSADRMNAIADYFGVTVDYLLTGETSEGYYINPETAKAAQEIFENKELSILFDAARDASPEDLRAVHAMLLALKRKEQNED